MKRLTLALLVLALALPGHSQTREKGPWWPSQWGPDDQAGASNRITAETVLKAVQLVTTGKMYELGQVYERGMPLFGERTYAMFIPGSPTGGPFGENNMLMYHDEFLCAEIGQVGTQFDGLAHIGTRMQMADGSTQDVFYNGVTADEMGSPYGVTKLCIEHVRSFVTRGVLIDIAGYKGVPTLAPDYEVTVADVRGALARQDMTESSIGQGDAVIFNYGWSVYWSNPSKYNDSRIGVGENEGSPGIGGEVARWLIERKVSMVGADSCCVSVMPYPPTGNVHHLLFLGEGIFLLENMELTELTRDQVYEFLFLSLTERIKGATGSPVRPIAVR